MLNAKIIQVKTKGNIVLNNGGKVINPEDPIWQKNGDIGIAAFFLNRGDPAQLEITVKINEAKPGDRYILEGLYNLQGVYHQEIVMFCGSAVAQSHASSSPVQSQPLSLVFEVSAKYEPGMFGRVTSENLSWRLTHKNTEKFVDIMSAALELYWLYGYDPGFFKRGVPVGILRQLAQACWITGKLHPPSSTQPGQLSVCQGPGIPEKKWIVSAVVNYCFFRNPPRYDFNGKHHFVVINNDFKQITLRLRAYLTSFNDPDALCNCYDQAAILQYFLRVIGISDVSYCKIQVSFSFKTTYLVGRTGCTHPNTMNRSPFMNHAFCSLREWDAALDSCIGPHTGNERFFQYLDNVVDVDTGVHTPGSEIADKIIYCDGVTDIDWISKLDVNINAPLIQGFMKKINYAPGKYKNSRRNILMPSWKTHIEKLGLGKNHWQLIYEDLIPGEGEVLKTWRYKRNGAVIQLDIYVSSRKYTELAAVYRFLLLGTHNMNSGITYKKEFNFLGPLSAVGKLENGWHIFWKAAANVVFDVKIINTGDNFEEIKKWIIGLNDFTSDQPRNELYMASSESVNTKEIKEVGVGQTIKVPVKTPNSGIWDFVIRGNGIQLIEEKGNTLYFKALEESENTIILAVVDPETLLVKNKEIKIQVTKPKKE